MRTWRHKLITILANCVVILIVSIVLHTFSKIHNFLISYPILLKHFLIGLSDCSAFIESELFFEWTCPLRDKPLAHEALLPMRHTRAFKHAQPS